MACLGQCQREQKGEQDGGTRGLAGRQRGQEIFEGYLEMN